MKSNRFNEQKLERFIETEISKKNGFDDIYDALVKRGYDKNLVNSALRDYLIRKILIKPIFIITLLLAVPSLLFLKVPVVGRGYLFPTEVVTEISNYADEINLRVSQNDEYNWSLANRGNLTSVRLSGSITKSGSARVYLRDGGIEYLIFDSEQLSEEYLSPITGFELLEILNEIINETLVTNLTNETVNVTLNETIPEENITIETNETELNETIHETINISYDKEITINLAYKDDTEYDTDNDGVETIDGIIDFTVEDSSFNWDVNYSNLCTRWEVFNQESSTFVCYGAERCCNFVDLVSISSNWNDSFTLNYGKYDADLNNTVAAQVIYVDYSLDPDNAYEDISYSDLTSLKAIFEPEFYSFEDVCLETCLLPNLEHDNYTLIFEIDNATLNIDSISYAVSQLMNITQKNISVVNETTQHYKVVINKPVKWVKKVRLSDTTSNLTIEIPRDVTNISVHKIEKEKKKKVKNVFIEIDEEVADLETYNLVTGGAFRTDLSRREGWFNKFIDWIVKTGLAGLGPKKDKNSTIIIEEEVEEIEVEYYTEGPKSVEERINKSVKKVVISSDIHYEDVLAYSYLETEAKIYEVKLYWLVNGSRQEVGCDKYDTNFNGLIDYIEWIVPALSDQTYEIVIEIIKAQHLDENKTIIADIFSYVSERDGIWSNPIAPNEYVRVWFEKNLTNENDISIYARSNDSAKVEVYVNDTLIAKFEAITIEGWYKVYLDNLTGGYDVFDLKILGYVEFDQIIDPTIIIVDVSVDADLDNITAERNFTHLTISEEVPYNDLELYMPFDVNITNATDYTLNHNDGVVVGAKYINSGRYGSGIKFDGIDDFINVTDSSSLVVGEVSISFWFRPNETYVNPDYVSFIYHSDYEVYIDEGDMVFDFKGSKINFTESVWNEGQWYHVVATYDGTTRMLYIDGVNETTVIVSPAFTVQDSSGDNVAVFSDEGDLTLLGQCNFGGDCVDPGDDTFIIQNSIGEVVAFINNTGDLCIEEDNCNDNDANCNTPGDGAFIVQNEYGVTVSYINASGDLCLIGGLVENGNP
jgi:hypothetical protein